MRIEMHNEKAKLKNLRYLGVDWGEKRVGLALGDGETGMAVPFRVVSNADDVARTAKEEGVDIIVLGKPVGMSGAETGIVDKFLEFREALESGLAIPIKTVDERLTSKQADALAGDKKTKAPRDAVAAMLILQSYFDAERERNNSV